jgi:hypothetical protein
MSTIVWTTLITAVATVTGSLGAIWLKGLYDDKTQARQAEDAGRRDEQASAAAISDRQRDAYAGLLGTARYWLSAALEIQQEFEGLPKDTKIDRSRILVQELTQAVARVELVGTDAARSGAETVYNKAIAAGLVFAHYAGLRAEAKKTGSHIPEFDNPGASEAIGALEAEIQSFLECVRREQGTSRPHAPSAAAPPDPPH